MDINVEHAKITDLKNIQELNLMLFKKEKKEFDSTLDCDWPFSKEGTSYFKKSITSKNSLALIAKNNNKIVGYLIGSLTKAESFRLELKMAEIENMLIIDEYRNQGIGSKLIEKFLEWCKSKKVNRLKVTASALNENAKRFYNKIGFKEYSLTLEMDF